MITFAFRYLPAEIRLGEITSSQLYGFISWLRARPGLDDNKSGMVSLNQLQKRIVKVWKELDLNPIGLQDSRHTAATWFDHAKISAKVASVFMGHKAPKRQPDAAPITLQRYTPVLPGELERARD